MLAGAATVLVAASPAAAAAKQNPVTGCIGANNMMPAPGMSTQGWGALPDTNPGVARSFSGMHNAMVVSDPQWPAMCIG